MAQELRDLEYVLLNCCRVSVEALVVLVMSLKKLKYLHVTTHTTEKPVDQSGLVGFVGAGLECTWSWKDLSMVGATGPLLDLMIYPSSAKGRIPEVVQAKFEGVFKV